MNIKAIVLDIDGTLTNHDKKITKETLNALLEMEEKGVCLILNSGRSLARSLDYAYALKMDAYQGYVLHINGSALYRFKDNSTKLYSQMHEDELQGAMKLIQQHHPDVEMMVMGYQDIYLVLPKGQKQSAYFNENHPALMAHRQAYPFTSIDALPEAYFKLCVIGESEQIDAVMKTCEKYLAKPYWFGRTMPNWLEISNDEMDKGKALRLLREELGLKKEEVLVFGDGENDIAMFKEGISIAMGNAFANVKPYAEFVTLDNEQEGIAYALKKLSLIG